MLPLVRRHPFVLPVVLLAVLVASWAWRVGAADSPPSSVVTIDPARIVDTRDDFDVGIDGPIVNGVSQKVQVTGQVPTTTGSRVVVPVGATGVLLNVTVIAPNGPGFLSVRPGTASGVPATSNLNFVAGRTVPNAVTVALPTTGAAAGTIDLRHGGPITGSALDVAVDVVGYVLANEPAAGVQTFGADQLPGDDVSTLEDDEANALIVSLSVDVPSAGQLLVNGTLTASDMEADAFVGCGVSTDGTNPVTAVWESAGTEGSIGQIAVTELFEVAAGTTVVELRCSAFRASDGNSAVLSNGRLTAVFTPS